MRFFRLKIFAASLAFTTMMTPVEAHAFAFSAVLGAIGAAIFAAGGPLTGLAFLGGTGAGIFGSAVGTFLTSGFGSLLVSVGLSAAQYFLTPKAKAPTIESARVNVRIGEPFRWLHAGRARAGGAALFGEYGPDGSFWYIVVHGDSELRQIHQILFDEIPITLNEDNEVITDEFTTAAYGGGGSPIFSIWTTTWTPDNPSPPAISEFKAAFPAWTDDHLLVGTTYSVIRGLPLKPEDRYKAYTWRGPIGLGEPGVSIVGDWSYIYDPRDTGQDIDDRSTWGTSRNPALIWAWFRTHPYGRNKPLSSINWDKVAEQADICDETVLDKNGLPHARYACGTSIVDSKERHVAETEILLSADAVIMHDEQGKAYPMVGHYIAPTLTLSRKRDIMGMQSREATDGEMETDGVVVKYIEPDFNYVAQPCAAWVNPLFYVPGTAPRYLEIEVLTCQNHNQAVRLAKAFGQRTQSAHRLAPTVGLRGIRARRERIIDLQYDDAFSGSYEIATPVEIDEPGVMSSFGLVPIDENRWTLLEGEEGDKPAPSTPIEYDATLPLATGVTVEAVPLAGSGGSAVRLEATFDASPRIDWRYRFEYRKVGDLTWRPMVVLMEEQLAYSDTIIDGADYEVQYWTETTSGRASDPISPPITVSAVADPVAPTGVIGLSETSAGPHLGHAPLTLVLPNDEKRVTVGIYRVATGGTLDTSDPAQEVEILATGGTATTSNYVHGDATVTNALANSTFPNSTGLTLGTGWSVGSGIATKAAAGAGSMVQTPTGLSGSTAYWRLAYDALTVTAGNLRSRLNGMGSGAQFLGTYRSTTGRHRARLLAGGSNTSISIEGDAASAGTVDNWTAFAETGACADPGIWDYYAVPRNGSNVEGTPAGPVTISID